MSNDDLQVRQQHFASLKLKYKATKYVDTKRIVKNSKGKKRQEVVEYLLKKDPQQYAWAKFYRHRSDKS